MAQLAFNVLGPLEVTRDGTALALGGPKQRSVLAMLVIQANRVVPTGQLIDAVWGEDAHDRAGSTLQVYVANLRKILEPDRTSRDGYEILQTRSPGYVLDAPGDTVDLLVFERCVTDGRNALAHDDPEQAASVLRQALGLWRGEPLADLRESDTVFAEATRLEELRIGAVTARIEADLACGRHGELVGELEQLIAAHPFNEGFRAQLMLALYRNGRQADALRAYGEARTVLIDELGIEPGAPLRNLEAAILNQDPTLDSASGGAAADASDQQAVVPTRRIEAGDSGLGALTLPDGSRHLLGSTPCTIGRVAECSLTILDADVSRRHAVIRQLDGGFVVSDLGSTNGTTVNGAGITEHRLEPGDEIVLGSTSLRYDPI